MSYRASAPFTADWRHFAFAVEQGVGTVRFDRPDRLNALALEVYADLRTCSARSSTAMTSPCSC